MYTAVKNRTNPSAAQTGGQTGGQMGTGTARSRHEDFLFAGRGWLVLPGASCRAGDSSLHQDDQLHAVTRKSIKHGIKELEMAIHHIERAFPPTWFLSPSKRRNPPQILGSRTHLDTLTYTTWRRGERELSCIIGCGRRRSILCVLCSTGWGLGGWW